MLGNIGVLFWEILAMLGNIGNCMYMFCINIAGHFGVPFFINIFDMLVCFLVCFYVTIFAWLLLTFSQIWEFLYMFCIYMVGHLVCLFYINIFDNMVCFLVCFYIKMFVWLLFPLFSNMGVPLHSLYTKSNLIQRIYKCIDVFSL